MSQNAIKTEAKVRSLIDILGALALESFVSLRALNDGDLTMALDLILGGRDSDSQNFKALFVVKNGQMWCAHSHLSHVRKCLLVGSEILGFGIRNSAICSLESR